MTLQDKETDRHWCIGLRQHRMFSAEELGKLDYVVVALTHLFPIDGDHVIMDPVTGGHFMIANRALRDLAFVVRELQVHTATMDVELITQVFLTHRRAFDMPSRKPFTPRALPAHDVFRWRIFPERKIT